MTQIKYQKKQGLVHFKNKVAKTFLAFYENGYQSPPRLFQLNDVCFEILRLLEAPKTADEIASCLSVKYPDDKKQAAADANRYLKFLLDNGLIGEARDGGYRVLFVYPHIRGKSNSAFPPIGLLSLGACLEEKGGGAKIYDFQLQGSDARALFKHIEDNSYDVIGFSANSVNVDLALQLSAAVRAFFPEKRIIFGGPHSTFEHEKILNNHPEIDMVFLGEAELSIFPGLQFLFSNFYGEPPANVAFRRNGRVECARKAQEPFDLGSLKVLDFSKIVNMKNAEEYPEYPVMTARGCPFNCSFCTSAAFWGHKYRCRSIPGVIDEIRQAKLKYGYKEFNIVDDTLTADRERFLEFCREVKKEKIRWACLSRVDGIDAEVLSNMREAGCYAIFFGIESLDASALESVHKFRKKMSEDYLREVIEMRKRGLQAVPVMHRRASQRNEREHEKNAGLFQVF